MSIANVLFPLGRLLQTPGARDELDGADVARAVQLHARGEWGQLSQHDRDANDQAVLELGRIVSSYRDRGGRKFYIITEADRSATTVLLPEEY